ncbi:MAG: hypothetical protein JWP81_5150 [Ferruginibacter sp.]|nr:hypothetical protein [Ferruginibacter sp.]
MKLVHFNQQRSYASNHERKNPGECPLSPLCQSVTCRSQSSPEYLLANSLHFFAVNAATDFMANAIDKSFEIHDGNKATKEFVVRGLTQRSPTCFRLLQS